VVTARLLRTVGLFNTGQQIYYESNEGRLSGGEWLGTITFWALVALGSVGVRRLSRNRMKIWPLLAMVLVVLIQTAGVYGSQRFRIAAEPSLVVLAAVGLLVAWPGLRRWLDRSLTNRSTMST
jgi:hypothetical protein